jgi:hypothetical protein
LNGLYLSYWIRDCHLDRLYDFNWISLLYHYFVWHSNFDGNNNFNRVRHNYLNHNFNRVGYADNFFDGCDDRVRSGYRDLDNYFDRERGGNGGGNHSFDRIGD